MRRATTTALFLSAVMALAAVSVCAPPGDASESDSISVIVPSEDLSMEDPIGLILGFEHMSAEIDRAQGTVLILMTGAPYEDDEIFVAVTEAIGPDLFVTCKDLGSLGEFDFLEDPANPPPEQPLSKGVDLDFLEQILAFVESSMRWMMLADDLESEIRWQEQFASKMNASCAYTESRSCEVGQDRRDDDSSESCQIEPVIVEDADEDQPESHIAIGYDLLPMVLLTEVDDAGVLPVIGRGTVF